MLLSGRKKDETKNQPRLQSFICLAAFSPSLCSPCVLFLNKSLFIPAVDFYLTQQLFVFFMRISTKGKQTNVSHSETSRQPSHVRFMCQRRPFGAQFQFE